MDLLWIVPTRGRPANAVRLHAVWRELSVCSDIVFVVADDDPELDAYRTANLPMKVVRVERRGLVDPLNQVAVATGYRHIGFMGDDHLPRTHGFDRHLIVAAGRGISYPNDLLRGEELPTAVVVASWIIDTLGFMVPPSIMHLYSDNFWMRLGQRLDALTYVDDVIIEHMHPEAGKAVEDEGYQLVNSEQMYADDEAAFTRYVDEQLDNDIARLQAVMPC